MDYFTKAQIFGLYLENISHLIESNEYNLYYAKDNEAGRLACITYEPTIKRWMIKYWDKNNNYKTAHVNDCLLILREFSDLSNAEKAEYQDLQEEIWESHIKADNIESISYLVSKRIALDNEWFTHNIAIKEKDLQK